MNTKFVDRLAAAAIFAAIAGIPALAHAAGYPMRQPALKIAMPEGFDRVFYTSGPMGTTTFRVDVNPDGTERARKQVLSDDVFQAIGPGMSVDDVVARIGPPSSKMRFDNTKTTAWDYRYRDTWGYDAEFSVIVDDGGRVVGKTNVRLGD